MNVIMENPMTSALVAVCVVVVIVIIISMSNTENFAMPESLSDDAPVYQQVPMPTREGLDNLGAPLPDEMPEATQQAENTLRPSELLPVNQKDTDFAKANPTVDGILANKNFLTAGSVIGMLSEPHRNSNLSIRAEPVITKQVLSPWNNSTFVQQPVQGLGDVV